MIKTGIIADDITGAQDIGVMLAKQGLTTRITQKTAGRFPADTEVLIQDTDSRFDSSVTAYRKVRQAASRMKAEGCGRFYKKTCSVFRGNIGAEFDALLDETGEDFGIVSAAFIKNGRQTIQGIHYVHGQKIADSPFRSDPVNPIHESELARIIQEQSQRKTKIATLAEIRRGPESLKAFVERSKQECSYLIFDGETQDDLKIIAAAVHQEKIFLGGSGLAEELAVYWAEHAPQPRTFPTLGTRTMILAGSLTPQTHKQIQLLEQTPQSCSVVLDPLALFDKQTALLQAEQAKARMKAALDKDLIPLVYFQNDAAVVRQTKDRGRQCGWTETRTAQELSSALASLVHDVIQDNSVSRVLSAGGDTSARFIEHMKMEMMDIVDELEPGLCSTFAYSDCGPLLFILKSGSFGSDSFFISAADYLRHR